MNKLKSFVFDDLNTQYSHSLHNTLAYLIGSIEKSQSANFLTASEAYDLISSKYDYDELAYSKSDILRFQDELNVGSWNILMPVNLTEKWNPIDCLLKKCPKFELVDHDKFSNTIIAYWDLSQINIIKDKSDNKDLFMFNLLLSKYLSERNQPRDDAFIVIVAALGWSYEDEIKKSSISNENRSFMKELGYYTTSRTWHQHGT